MAPLFIVIPAYNESANLAELVAEWHPVVESVGGEARLVIIDDGSRDDSCAVLQNLAPRFPQLTFLTKPNSGHGATVYFGYRYALEQGADFIFQTDSDRQTLPAEFWPFWEKRDTYDAVIGVRNARQDGASRVFVTRVLRLSLLLTTGLDVRDANTPFRLMRRDALEAALALMPPGHFLTNVLLSATLQAQRREMAWLPITFRPRTQGVNSINMKRITRIGLQACRDFWAYRKVLRSIPQS